MLPGQYTDISTTPFKTIPAAMPAESIVHTDRLRPVAVSANSVAVLKR